MTTLSADLMCASVRSGLAFPTTLSLIDENKPILGPALR